jgi:hypothetical protein
MQINARTMRSYYNQINKFKSFFKHFLIKVCTENKGVNFKNLMYPFGRQSILRNLYIAILAVFLISFSDPIGKYFFDEDFSFQKVDHIKPITLDFNDPIPNDSLFVCYSKDSIPNAYFRNIFTPICIDGQCLPIYITLYWTPGGAYLGYSLEEKEILTKGEKEVPFTEKDYQRLHQLLGDPNSILESFPLYDSGVTDNSVLTNNQVDALSGATSEVLENYVVPGAVYTTNTLYHIVHGTTADSVRVLSSKNWSNQLFTKLISSNKITDNEFGISRIGLLDKTTLRDFIPLIEELIHSSDYLTQHKIIEGIISSKLPQHEIQKILAQIFSKSEYRLKQSILNYLKSFKDIDNTIYQYLLADLSQESAYTIKSVFELLEQENDLTNDLINKVSTILNNENTYIVKLTNNFLSNRKLKNAQVPKELKKNSN